MGKIVRLDVRDFKSYKGEQTIGPFKSFTAVIGPNGSGKSNLMDAVSFCLGVETKQLRGDQLKDLVYNADGRRAELRREASVTMVYVPSPGEVKGIKEGQEMHFQRSISHSGSSKYRLQGKTVGRKEYHDKLKEIGVLVKARNFLVFQGDVENIASMSPAQLTSFFEDLSGSGELAEAYEELRAKKYAAETDTIFTFKQKKGIMEERKQVREQKAEVERFNSKRAEVEALKTDYFLLQLWQAEQDIEKHQSQVRVLEDELADATHRENVVETMIDEKKKAEAVAGKAHLRAETQVRGLRKALSALEPESIKAAEQVAHLRKKDKAEKRALVKAQEAVGKKEEERVGLTEDIGKMDAAEKVLETKLEAAKAACPLSSEQMSELEEIREKAMADNLTLQSKLETQQRNVDMKTERLHALQKNIDTMIKRKEAEEAEAKQLVAREAKMRTAIQGLQNEEGKAKSTLALKRTELSELRDQRTGLEERLFAANQVLHQAKSSRAASQKEAKMAEFVDTLKAHFSGVRGRMVDLCTPTSRKYDLAITVALGRQMDSIVVDKEETGRECIKYLRDKRAGVATFLPLDTIEPKQTKERHRQLGSKYKLAVDVLKYDDAMDKAIQYVLAGVVICSTLDDARDLCFRRKERVKAVTLDGHIISTNGDMTGGTQAGGGGGRQTNRFEQKELEQARRKRDELQNQIGEVNDRLFEVAGHQAGVTGARGGGGSGGGGGKRGGRGGGAERGRRDEQLGGGEIQAMEMQVANAENRLKFARLNLEASKSKLEKLKNNAEKIASELRRVKPEKQKLEAALAQDEEALEKLEATATGSIEKSIDAYGKRIGVANIRQAVDEARAEIDTLEDNLAKVRDQRSKLRSQLRYIKSQTLENAVKRAAKKAQETGKLLETKETEASRAATKLEEKRGALEQAESELEEKKAQLEEARVESQEASKARDQALLDKASIMKKLTNVENQIEKLRAKRHATLRKAEVDQVNIPLKANKKKRRRSSRGSNDQHDDSDDFSSMDDNDEEEEDGEGESKAPMKRQRVGTSSTTVTSTSSSRQESSSSVNFSRSDSTAVLQDKSATEAIDFERLKTQKLHMLNDLDAESKLKDLQNAISDLQENLDKMQPNMKADEKYVDVSQRLENTDAKLQETRQQSQNMDKEFERIKSERQDRFNSCFQHVEETIDTVYRELTRSSKHPLGGNAYLSVDNADEPYLGGIKYTAMPPNKRFRDMDQMSGGEKSVAALALLFAIHSYRPAPFFVMDECDAALDAANVNKVSNYIRKNSPNFQCLVISLKDAFYDKADALVGIYREQKENCSKSVTLDLTPYTHSK